MKKFTIYWFRGSPTDVVGDTIADACRRARITGTMFYGIDYYEVEGKVVKVAGQATCRCSYGAQYGFGCFHDVSLAGLI